MGLRKTSSPTSVSNSCDPNDEFDPEEKLGFDVKFFKRFWTILKILIERFPSTSSSLLLILIAVAIFEEYVVYQVGLIPSKFYVVLGDKDLSGFWKLVLKASGIIVGIAAVKSARQYLIKLLTVTWRGILCRYLHRFYFSELIYYQLNALDKKIDNPDQRITQDVDKFTSTWCEILPKTAVAPAVIAYYTYQGFVGTGWQGPVSCFVFFMVGTVINKIIMGPIVNLVAKQERCEGDFRFLHLQVKVNAESIAFHDAAVVEGAKADSVLSILLKAQNRLYFWQLFLNAAINLFDYFGSIISYLIVAIPIFSGSFDDKDATEISSIISKNSFVSMYLVFQFSQLVDSAVLVTNMAGVTHRICQLIDRIHYLRHFWDSQFLLDPSDQDEKLRLVVDQKFPNNPDSEDGFERAKKVVWNLDTVTFNVPFKQHAIVRDLKMTISTGNSVLIRGGSGTGKSSILRLLRGLWPHSKGKVENFHPAGPSSVFFVPQKTFLTAGSLRDQFSFPLKASSKDRATFDQKVYYYINLLSLQHVLNRVGSLDEPVPWNVYDSLSPGEVQRINFVRLFVHSPMIAMLDEATSALPLAMEDLVYTEVQKLGMTVVSVGHRESLRKYHDVVLTLEGEGSWKLESV